MRVDCFYVGYKPSLIKRGIKILKHWRNKEKLKKFAKEVVWVSRKKGL